MSNNLYSMLKDYFNNLFYSGYTRQEITDKIVLLDFIENLTKYPDFQLYATCEDILIIETLLNYINNNIQYE